MRLRRDLTGVDPYGTIWAWGRSPAIKTMTVQYRKTCKHCGANFLAGHARITYCGETCKLELKKAAKARKAQQDRARYEQNPQAVKGRVAEWKKQNRDKVNEANRRQYADPVMGVKYKERLARYTEANREVCERRWHENVRRRIETGEHQALTHKRRRNVKVNTPEMTPAEKFKLAQFYRVARLLTKRYGVPFDVDHIIPLSRGGAHHPSNLQILTASENRKKSAKLPSELAA